MKLPVLWIVAALGAGIAVSGRWQTTPRLWIVAFLFIIPAAGILLWRNSTRAAWLLSLCAWFALGGTALTGQSAAVPSNQVSRLIARGAIDTSEALRWRGRLREDRIVLPWGTRYEIDLEEVEIAGRTLLVRGGLRANLYGNSHVAAGRTSEGELLRAGDRVEALLRAQPPRNFLDPGAFDTKGYLAGQDIDLVGSLRSAELLHLISRPSPTISQRLARARGALLSRLDALFPHDPARAALLRAMLLGDRSFVDSEVVVAFQKTAVYHVLVVAGLHVGALVVFLFWLCRRLRLSPVLTSLITLSLLLAYVGVVQDRPPILRAALMAAFYLCARPLVRRVELLNSIALAALAILLWNPSSLADSSFELSFLAAGVIAGLALPWIERTSSPYRNGLRHLGDVTRDGAFPPKITQFRIEMRAASGWLAQRLPTGLAARANSLLSVPLRAGLRLWDIVLLSIVIQWGMIPLLARDFHRVSWAGPITNIPAVLLTGLIVPLGFLTLIATMFWTPLAGLLAKILGFCAGLLLASVEWFGRLPRVSYRIPGPPAWLTLVFFAAFILLAIAARSAASRTADRKTRRQLPAKIAIAEWAAGSALVALTILIATHPFRPQLARGKFEVNVLDVGQGDSIFVAFPDGRTMLVDGGGLAGSERVGGYRSGSDVGEEVVSPYLWSRGLKKLDVVALSHAHHDHLDGLYAVLDNFRVGELWVGRDEETPAFEGLLAEARNHGIPVIHKTAENNFNWDGVKGEILWPPADAGPVSEASNDDSMVIRVTDGGMRFLLPGDIEQRLEDNLVAANAPLAADFLKVPHHGSKTSSTVPFLAAVRPKIAVASVGEGNAYGHPAENIVERYASDGVRLLRTDRDGAVTAISDGQYLSVHTYREGTAE